MRWDDWGGERCWGRKYDNLIYILDTLGTCFDQWATCLIDEVAEVRKLKDRQASMKIWKDESRFSTLWLATRMRKRYENETSQCWLRNSSKNKKYYTVLRKLLSSYEQFHNGIYSLTERMSRGFLRCLGSSVYHRDSGGTCRESGIRIWNSLATNLDNIFFWQLSTLQPTDN